MESERDPESHNQIFTMSRVQSKITRHMKNQENLNCKRKGIQQYQLRDETDVEIVKDFKASVVTMI